MRTEMWTDSDQLMPGIAAIANAMARAHNIVADTLATQGKSKEELAVCVYVALRAHLIKFEEVAKIVIAPESMPAVETLITATHSMMGGSTVTALPEARA